ncbi:hypothetical protein CERSUDRAFT_120136 [Gelatoporia subvermispora B]|uniref:Uncharacterized protein n=1 Tax=Ceriporiopsis subvermispora (strain B) TaxID=914234 RepID=M2P6X8_CERS8|nr:hypothetical protein CERSUDRAFT_120136 [Gelatoporia subvermispora B]
MSTVPSTPGDSRSSASTLVNSSPTLAPEQPSYSSSPPLEMPAQTQTQTPMTPDTAASPFSASFDPNGPLFSPAPVALLTPPAIRDATASFALMQQQIFQQHLLAAALNPMGSVGPVGAVPARPMPDATVGTAEPSNPASALWANRLSASFGAIAEQIAAASKALANVEVPTAVGDRSDAPAADADGALQARLEVIERSQERLAEELDTVRGQLARLNVSTTGKGKAERPVSPEVKEETREKLDGLEEVGPEVDIRMLAGAVQELSAKVDGIVETIKLDQARLYARLMNATVTVNKMPIKALPMANGKPPQNFPVTKGEFEHLTKERYEQLLKSYGQPIKGDTNAKREAVREFIGLTPADGKK